MTDTRMRAAVDIVQAMARVLTGDLDPGNFGDLVALVIADVVEDPLELIPELCVIGVRLAYLLSIEQGVTLDDVLTSLADETGQAAA